MEERQQYKFIKEQQDITRENYREYKAINYSTLSSFADNPSNYGREQRPATDGMILGNIIDSLIFDGHYPKDIILDFKDKPSGQMLDFVSKLFEIGELSEESYLEAYQHVGFKRDTIDKVKERFNLEGKDYYDFLISSKDKSVVSWEMLEKANKCNEKWKSSELVAKIINGKEVYTQVPITFPIELSNGDVIQGKGLIDLVVVDNEYKTIMMYDLKSTSSSVTAFKSSYMKYKYYLQSSFYLNGLKSITDYTVFGFSFLVISTTTNEPVVCFDCTEKDIEAGMYGATSSVSGYNIKGYLNLINELYLYHLPTDKWDLPFEFKDGIVPLSAFNGYSVNYE